jgi:site-specific recombinase XerD
MPGADAELVATPFSSRCADLQVVKERLGHASIATTERYLHSLPTADKTALDALSRIRQPQAARPA